MGEDERIEITLASGEKFYADLPSLSQLFEDKHVLITNATTKRIKVRSEKFLEKKNFLAGLEEIENNVCYESAMQKIYTLPGGYGRHPFGVPALVFCLDDSTWNNEHYNTKEQWQVVFSNFLNFPIASADYDEEEKIYGLAELLHEPLDALETMFFLKHSEDVSFQEKLASLQRLDPALTYAKETLNILPDIPSISDETLNLIAKETALSCSRISIVDPDSYRYIEAPSIIKISTREKYNVKQIDAILAPYGLVALSGRRKPELFDHATITKYAVAKKYKKMFSTYPRNISQVFAPLPDGTKKSILSFLVSGLDGILKAETLTIEQKNEWSRIVK